MFTYQARLDSIVDGDTVDVDIDLGFSIRYSQRIRLRGIDTAETWFQPNDSEEYQRGIQHTRFAHNWFEQAQEEYDPKTDNRQYVDGEQPYETVDDVGQWPLIIRTFKWQQGSYNRYLGEIIAKHNDEHYTDAVIEAFPDHDIAYEFD